jgi:hypothetical protein
MRQVFLNLAVSLVGFIEGPNGEFDWCFTDQDYGMRDFMNRINAIFIRTCSIILSNTKIVNSRSEKYKL